jgi:hypothetical protein
MVLSLLRGKPVENAPTEILLKQAIDECLNNKSSYLSQSARKETPRGGRRFTFSQNSCQTRSGLPVVIGEATGEQAIATILRRVLTLIFGKYDLGSVCVRRKLCDLGRVLSGCCVVFCRYSIVEWWCRWT